MKKILLLISCLIISIATAFAVEGLNPYAYKLEYHGQSDNNRKMTLKYWLNAPAQSVSITVSYMHDDAQQVVSYEGTTNEGENTVTVSTAGLPANTPLSWSVTVNQTTKIEPTQISTYHRLYCPQGVAVNTNPYSQHFGRVFVTESLHNHNGSGYVSSKDGKIQAGIYTFSPQFQLEGSIGDPKGNKNFSQVLTTFKSETWTDASFDGGHQPYQIKISEDDRIFVSSGDKRSAGAVIWELDTNDLETLTPIIRHTTNTFNSNYQILNDDGSFFAGFNCSMDVKGSGDDLTLLLYSANRDGVHAHHKDAFRLDEYQIGTKKSYNDGVSIAQKNISYFSKKTYGVVYDKVNVIYDYDGGYWFAASRGIENNTTEPNLAHVRQDGTEDTRSYTHEFYGGAGIMLHKTTYDPRKNETWLFKGLSRSTTSNGRFGIWKITKDNSGKTTCEDIWTVVSTGLGRNHNAFSLDYAENLYVVGNSGKRIIAYALPYSGTKTTPAKSAFELAAVDNSQTFQVVTNVAQAGYGTTVGDGRYYYEEQVTVTATPSDPNRYEFVEWTTSTGYTHKENPFTFNINRDITFTAHFKVKKYKVEYFNLFEKPTDLYEGLCQDITDYFRGGAATMDKTRSSRLWRLFQVEFNNKYKHNLSDHGTFADGRYKVTQFFAKTNYNTTIRNNLEEFLDTDKQSPFYWLGQYIEHIEGNGRNKDINAYSYSGDSYNMWGFYLSAFINRTVPQNASGSSVSYLNGGYNYPSFSEYGKPTHWRKWWQQIELELDTITTYDSPMPITWSMRTPPEGNINGAAPSNWYKWNDDAANPGKLLGWYYGEKNPDTWTDNKDNVEIVHNVYKSGNLIAIWLDKELHEAKNNYDVTKLLKTNDFSNKAHSVSVYRPLQAGMYNTICLPFSLTTLAGTPYEGATVLKLHTAEVVKADENNEFESERTLDIYFTEVTFADGDIMQAGVPYLIQPLTDIPNAVTFSVAPSDVYDIPVSGLGEVVYDFVEEGQSPSIAFHGVISPTHLPNSPHTLILVADNRLAVPEIHVDDSEDENISVSSGDQMLGLRGYFTLKGNAAAHSLAQQSVMHIGKKVTTDTPEVPEEEEVEITQPTINKPKKVMYQGQIYILRGNEVYDLNGRLLRKQ